MTTLHKMTVFWNKVRCWITNCFSATQVPILSCEACLPPLVSLLPRRHRMVALRLSFSPPEINPASARLPATFPSLSDFRAADTNRPLTVGLKNNYITLRWNQLRPYPAGRSHLPIDEIAHLLVPLSLKTSLFPLVNSHLLLALPPVVGPAVSSYSHLKTKSKALLKAHWTLQAPPPPYYSFSPMSRLHAFIGLDHFTAERIHQMKSGKCYLAAHTS